MDGDPGLAPSPWVSVELRDGGVYVDGTPVEVVGAPEDRYLAALQRIADRVAVPLGRRVGVSVNDGRGVTHLAIHPDGTAESIEDLVREATRVEAAAAASPEPEPARRPRLRDRPGRPVLWAATALLGVSAVVGAAVAVGAATDRAATDLAGAAAPATADPSMAAATSTPTVTVTRWRNPSVTLVSDASALGRGRLLLLVGADAPRVRVVVRVVTADGSRQVRRVVLHGGIRRLVLRSLPGGEAAWRISARGAKPLRGTVLVTPLPPPPPPPAAAPVTSPAPAGPSTAPGGRSGGGRGQGSGQSDAAPVIPVDPDDL